MTGGRYNEQRGRCRRGLHLWKPKNIRIYYTKDGVMKRTCIECQRKARRTYLRRYGQVRLTCKLCHRRRIWDKRPGDYRVVCTDCAKVLDDQLSDYWVQWHKERVAKGLAQPAPTARRKPYDRPSRAKPKDGGAQLPGQPCEAGMPELQGPRVLGHDHGTEAVPLRSGRERIAA